MIGLFLSEAFLFMAAAVIGFAIGWRLFTGMTMSRRRAQARTLDQLRQTLTELQVRRARSS